MQEYVSSILSTDTRYQWTKITGQEINKVICQNREIRMINIRNRKKKEGQVIVKGPVLHWPAANWRKKERGPCSKYWTGPAANWRKKERGPCSTDQRSIFIKVLSGPAANWRKKERGSCSTDQRSMFIKVLKGTRKLQDNQRKYLMGPRN